MKVTIFGTGYVGLVTGACFAESGNDVCCVDIVPEKIAMLQRGEIPIYEPGLAEIVEQNVHANRLHFTTDEQAGIDHGDFIFIAVGTPPLEDGSSDLRYVENVAHTIGQLMTTPKLIVNKSTVPIGTADLVRGLIREQQAARGVDIEFDVVSNPEFLKEGAAIDDFMRPDRIVVGSADERATQLMRQLYAPFERNHAKLMVMDVRSAELAKYAANAMLATRISFMNEMALLAERVGADIEAVRRGIGSDVRIGTHFLYAGCGYGGSCFPKDVQALLRTAGDVGIPLSVLDAVEHANERQKQVLPDKVMERFGADLTGRTFAIWGLAFKPNTDDMRAAPSQHIVRALLRRGARVQAYDPVAIEQAKHVFAGEEGISYSASAFRAAEGADALLILTEWKEFRSPDLEKLRSLLRQPVVFDGRNILDPAAVREAGLEYTCIGRP
jgi:UDPglucose 6-dehydrogenase